MATIFFAVVLLLLAALNLWATVVILRDVLCTRREKLAQAIGVWIVPLLGAVLALYLRHEHNPRHRESYGDPEDPMRIVGPADEPEVGKEAD